jgi:SAM-dependent methyltransferase
MPATDAQRWNQRYREGQHAGFERPRAFLLDQAAWLPTGGLALDVAMGLGANAGWLLARGLHVIGVDISEVAVRQARARFPDLQTIIADLTTFSLPHHTFDVIVNFYYLQRDLWPQFVQALRPGGVLIFETLTQAVRQVRPDISPEFLLAPGELRQGFAGLNVQVYREAWIETGCDSHRAVASMVATKPR